MRSLRCPNERRNCIDLNPSDKRSVIWCVRKHMAQGFIGTGPFTHLQPSFVTIVYDVNRNPESASNSTNT